MLFPHRGTSSTRLRIYSGGFEKWSSMCVCFSRSCRNMFVSWHNVGIFSMLLSDRGVLYVEAPSRWSSFETSKALAVRDRRSSGTVSCACSVLLTSTPTQGPFLAVRCTCSSCVLFESVLVWFSWMGSPMISVFDCIRIVSSVSSIAFLLKCLSFLRMWGSLTYLSVKVSHL